MIPDGLDETSLPHDFVGASTSSKRVTSLHPALGRRGNSSCRHRVVSIPSLQMDSIQSPMHDSKSTDDYSDIASDDAEGRPKDRRRYVRGGRKAGRRDSSRDELELLEGHQDSDARPVAPDACPYCAGKPQPPSPRPSPEQSAAAAPFDTGIRAFNIRRAAGGRRPVSVRAPPARRKPSAKRRGKQRTRPDDDEAAGAAADDDDGAGETEARDGGSRASTEGSASEAPRNAGAGKPMSIRLDLNLMVEVFLKAKIQGDVTITFLVEGLKG
ncbi:hypothetical protein PZA11_001132 [Diplocarpon coronariae]